LPGVTPGKGAPPGVEEPVVESLSSSQELQYEAPPCSSWPVRKDAFGDRVTWKMGAELRRGGSSERLLLLSSGNIKSCCLHPGSHLEPGVAGGLSASSAA